MMGLFSSPKGGESSSGNQAYPYLISNYGGWAPAGTNAMGAMSSLLGLGGMGGGPTAGWTIDMENDGIPGNAGTSPNGSYTIPGAPGSGGYGGGGGDAMGGFNNFLSSSAYDFIKDEAMSGLTNSAAGQGMLRSGATAKALQDRAANIGKTYFDNYLNHLTDVSKLSLGAGGLISGAGQWSKSKGPTQGGMGMDLISAGLQAAALFSDPAVKTKMERIGEWDDRGDGLGRWRFAYKWAPNEMLEGVMADEVERLRPEALGPLVRGYRTVNYAKLGEAA